MFYLRKPTGGQLARLAAEQGSRELSYAEHGATASAAWPAGYRHDRWTADLGDALDPRQFDRLAAALLSWRVQLDSGIRIVPEQPAEPGLTFALAFRLPVAGYVTAAGRVVYVTSEANRRGFAYGTLPAHPERGEEAFHLIRDGERVRFEVTAFSRPAHPAARLGAPVARLLQVRMNHAYLSAMRTEAIHVR